MLTQVELNQGTGGAKIQVDSIGGADFEVVKQAFGEEGTATMVSNNTPLPVKLPRPAISTVTSVADSNLNQMLLAANAARAGASIYNDSTEILYLKLGTVASTISRCS